MKGGPMKDGFIWSRSYGEPPRRVDLDEKDTGPAPKPIIPSASGRVKRLMEAIGKKRRRNNERR